VNIRWKENKHSYNLKALEIFLNEEILDHFWQNSIRNDPFISFFALGKKLIYMCFRETLGKKLIYLIFRITY